MYDVKQEYILSRGAILCFVEDQLCGMRTAEETARTNIFRVSFSEFLFLYRKTSEVFHESWFRDVTWISLSNI